MDVKLAEEKIKEYFLTEEKIEINKSIISSMNNKKIEIEEKNKNLQLEFDIDIKASSCEPKFFSGFNSSSYFENNIMKQIQRNEEIIKKLEEDIQHKINENLLLEIKNEQMKHLLNTLSGEFKNMLYLRYKMKESETYISEKLNLSKSQYHLLKKRTLTTIYNLLVMYKEI